jgi:cyclopropane fatty-acyl-phospholipid synthase-like methyltransferase
MNYRRLLYSNYSGAFQGAKVFAPEQQFEQYDVVYRDLQLGPDAAVLDIGCGKGEWLGWMQRQGFRDLIGVDGSESDTALAQGQWLGLNFVVSDAVDYLAQHPGQFDFIHCKDVIEHMTKDEIVRFMQHAHAALRDGGRLWLQTFNAQSPLASTTRYGDFTHEMGLTPMSIAQCLRACGYVDVSVKGLHYCSSSLGGHLRRLLGMIFYRSASLVIKLRHGSGGSRQSGIDAFNTLPDMVAVGTK